MRKKGIMFNQDPTNYYVFEDYNNADKKSLEEFIEKYKDTHITDFCICVNAVLSGFPSKVKTFMGDRYERAVKVNTSTANFIKGFNVIWKEKGLDLIQIWIDTLRRCNINPWLSIRMNDCHHHYDENGFFQDDDYIKHHKDRARVIHRKQTEYFDRCRNLEIKEERQLILDYIEETLERYDPYGLELDWQREMECFAPGHEWNGTKYITDIMKDIKAIVKRAEEKYNHEIKISVLCNPNPIYCLERGFDIIDWARQGLFDLFVPIGRWETTDNDMPIKLWKQILSVYNIEVAGGIQCLSNSDMVVTWEGKQNSYEMAIASATGIMSQGSDKLYLYNYMDDAIPRFEAYDKGKGKEEFFRLLSIADDIDEMKSENRRHVLTYNDRPSIWRKRDAQLPKEISKYNTAFFRILTGEIPEGATAVVKLGIKGDKRDFEVFVNSVKAEFLGIEDSKEPALTKSKLFCYKLDNADYKSDVQIIEVFTETETKETAIVDYAEIYIEA